MKPVKSHVFRGKRYNIKWVPPSKLKSKADESKGEVCFGICNPPTKKGKSIKIDNTLTDFDKLETIVHESLHAVFWDLDEYAVRDAAVDLSKLLWKLGYREQDVDSGLNDK